MPNVYATSRNRPHAAHEVPTMVSESEIRRRNQNGSLIAPRLGVLSKPSSQRLDKHLIFSTTCWWTKRVKLVRLGMTSGQLVAMQLALPY